jgi:3'(2'), 5'-bisphosphate nucleotidase
VEIWDAGRSGQPEPSLSDPSDDVDTDADAIVASQLARDAGELLLSVRASVGRLAIDRRQLGRYADQRANALILERLAVVRPDDAVLSEEAVDDPTARLSAARVWIIDPLDGTREFMMGRDDWAVHVALWEAGLGITAAAVALPAFGQVFATNTVGLPSDRSGRPPGPPVILVSPTRPPGFALALARETGAQFATMGSAGAKAMAVLCDQADAYLHADGQQEWDSAAPVGVLRAAGFHASRIDGSELVYNKADPYVEDFLMCRPELADLLLAAIARARAVGRRTW